MTKTQLKNFLADNGYTLQPDYNYTMLSIKVPTAEIPNLVTLLRENKSRIEKEYNKNVKNHKELSLLLSLLPFVCLPRKRSVLVPFPFGTAINLLSGVIAELPGLSKKVRLPFWH